MSRISGYDQRSEAVLTDEITGEIYVVYVNREIRSSGWTVNSLTCAHVDVETGKLVDRWAFDYRGNTRAYGSLSDRAFLVHDGHFYFLYYSEEDELVHLRTDNDTVDRLTLTLPAHGPVPHYRIIGIYNDRLYFMVREEKDGEALFHQYTIFLDDFDWSKVTVMVQSFEIARVEYLLKDRMLYVLMERIVSQDWPYIYDFVLDGINMTTGARLSPRNLDIEVLGRYAEIRFDIDSEGNLHIVLENQDQILYKVSPTGEVLSTVDLQTLWGEDNESYRILDADVLVNRTDHVYVIGRSYPNHYSSGVLASFVLSSDYSKEILRHIINDGDPRFFYWGNLATMNGTGAVYVAWHSLVDDLTQVLFSHQIPLTPDLEPNATGFCVAEEPGAPEPVTLSIPIDNVGRAPCRSYWVDMAYSLNGSGPFERLIDRRIDTLLRSGTSNVFELSTAIPQGSHRLRVVVHDVSPYENNVLNNVFEAWFYVASNNPPTIEILTPLDGQVVKDLLVLSGITEDLETGGSLTTFITGPPPIVLSIEARGLWNHTIDIADVVSGEYVFSFRAYDGTDYSGYVLRRVRISRDIDRLRLDSLSPEGDVALLEGEEETLFFNASDPLSRPLDHRWRIGSGRWTEGGNYHHFRGETPGRFSLQVEVTNGITSLSHIWNITVVELIPPRIDGFSPDDPSVILGKRERIDLMIVVVNPHGLPYQVIWTLDGNVLEGSEVHSRSLSFESSGERVVSALLLCAMTSESVSWDVTVTNSVPTLESWTPLDLILSIEEVVEVVFEVLATDGDGDPLDYLWTVDGEGLPSNTSGIVVITLPCNNDAPYIVEVQVTDGEAWESLEWTIQPEPPISPTVNPESSIPWKTVGLSIAILIAVVCSMLFAIYHVRGRSRQGPDSGES